MFKRLFSARPKPTSSSRAPSVPVSVISRTDPMTGVKQQISTQQRPASRLPLPSENYRQTDRRSYWAGYDTK